jgi:hypothetical protein
MANEVEIRITAHDLSGPAFASVMARIAAMKKALDDAFRDRRLNLDVGEALAKIEMLKKAADDISFGKINIPDLNTGLMALRSKLQSLGIADLADIDVQPGRLMTQLQLIKRLINQSGISDVLDFNLTPADLSAQFAKLGHVAYDIPIKFDMAKLPKLGNIGSEHVPITFDYGRVVGPHMPILNLPANVIIKDFIQHGQTMPVLDIPGNIDIKNIPKVGETGSVIDIPVNFDFKNIPTMGDVEVIKKAEDATSGLGYATAALGSNLTHTDQAFSPFLMSMLKMADESKKAEYNAGLSVAVLQAMGAAFLRTGQAIGGAFMNSLRSFGSGIASATSSVRGFLGAMGGDSGGGGGGGAVRAFTSWNGFFSASIGGIKLWHIALDGGMEAAIALGTAIVSLTIGLAAMAPTAQDIYTHLKAVATVNQSLDQQIPPLTGKFDDMARAMSSQTIEAYGGALNFVSQGAGGLARTASEVVTGLDDLVAKLDLWRSSQQSTGKVLETGVQFLHQFEQILGNVAGAIDNLVKADPGTAHFLMNIFVAGTKLLDVVTSLPTPILYTALAMHSMYLWGNVAAGVLGKLVGLVPGLKGLGDVLGHGFHIADIGNPYADLTIGVIALGAAFAYLAVQGNMATNQVRGDINATNAALNKMSASNAMGALIQDIARYQVAMKGAFSPEALQNINATTGSIQMMGSESDVAFGHFANAIHDLGLQQWSSAFKGFFDSVSAGFDKNAAATHIAQNNAAAYSAEIKKLVGEQGNLYRESGKLQQQGFSLAQSFALMDLAGVKVGDSFDLMQQKVKNLITGYQNMSVSGNILANSVNAITFANLQQQSGIQNLTAGWTAFFTMVSGGSSTFNTFAQDVSAMATDAKAAGATMTGLNDQSLTLRGGMLSAAAAAQTQMNALTTMASAAGLGTQGTQMLTQANKDYLAILLPAAKNSVQMTSILYALAQQGGYQGADSFKALAQWVGNVQNPMKSLDGITTTLTKDSAGLTQDVQNLSTALGQTLDNAMAQVIFTTSGGIGPMNALAKAIDQTGLLSNQTSKSALNVMVQFEKMTGSVSSAHGQFIAFAEQALGLTQKQAEVLWQHDLPALQNTINGMHGKTLPIKADTSQAQAATNAVQALINSLHGSTVYVKEVTQFYTQNLGSSTSQGRKVGGIVGAAAAGGMRGGLTLVGELGPEFVKLPQGSQVYPHGVTPGYASQMGGGGGGGQIALTVDSAGQSAFEQFMVTAIREWVRLKGGGNVQKAFGRNNG